MGPDGGAEPHIFAQPLGQMPRDNQGDCLDRGRQTRQRRELTMSRNRYLAGFFASTLLIILGSAACSRGPGASSSGSVVPETMRRIGTVDERFQSFNVEMVEVTGGRFWKPYKDIEGILNGQASPKEGGAGPVGMDPGLYQQRPPIDLSNARLRKLAAALAPSYVRVSGTWANNTYFHDSDTRAPSIAPKGFGGVLTRPQWKGVVDFSNAVDAKLVTSFATSPGTRDARGLWTPKEASKLLLYTTSVGGSVAAAEYMNEPTYAEMGGAPKGYDAAAYGRDVGVFVPFMKKNFPGTTILGPGSVGEGVSLAPPAGGQLKSEDLLKATGPVFDAFSYHSYGAASQRCASMGSASQVTAQAALSNEVLSRADRIEEFYAGLRDKYEPGKAMWLTETADAACGGNPWASTFRDTFRYLDQLGRLAKRGVQVHTHNTLASSDYGLLDDSSFAPRPNYWGALLWRKFMGTTVLDAGASPAPSLHLYAHCLRGSPRGVAILVINTDQATPQSLDLPAQSDRYTLTAQHLEDARVQLNGHELTLGVEDAIPQLAGVSAAAGHITFEQATITFLAVPNANNASCR